MSSEVVEGEVATLTLARMMTPEYASPEQVNGTAITTLSDVYSLGVVLYELLTGHRPYRLLSAAMHEVARVIAEVEPARPSDVVATTTPGTGGGRTQVTPEMVSAAREGDPDRLRRRLMGDLDAILLMALRKEPEGRYSSAEAFSEDLQRHLEHRAIRAREATPWERFRRFQRRDPGIFAMGIVFVIAFLFGLAAVALQARHDIQAAIRDTNIAVFPAPLLLYIFGVSICGVCAAVYFARAGKAQLLGAVGGGLIWALGMIGRLWVERNNGWWSSRIAGQPDPLMFLSPVTWVASALLGVAVMLVLFIIGRRFGWKGQALVLLLIGFGQPIRERIWFGEFIPALQYESGIAPIPGSAGMLIAAGVIALFVMRLIAGPEASSRDRQ